MLSNSEDPYGVGMAARVADLPPKGMLQTNEGMEWEWMAPKGAQHPKATEVLQSMPPPRAYPSGPPRELGCGWDATAIPLGGRLRPW